MRGITVSSVSYSKWKLPHYLVLIQPQHPLQPNPPPDDADGMPNWVLNNVERLRQKTTSTVQSSVNMTLFEGPTPQSVQAYQIAPKMSQEANSPPVHSEPQTETPPFSGRSNCLAGAGSDEMIPLHLTESDLFAATWLDSRDVRTSTSLDQDPSIASASGLPPLSMPSDPYVGSCTDEGLLLFDTRLESDVSRLQSGHEASVQEQDQRSWFQEGVPSGFRQQCAPPTTSTPSQHRRVGLQESFDVQPRTLGGPLTPHTRQLHSTITSTGHHALTRCEAVLRPALSSLEDASEGSPGSAQTRPQNVSLGISRRLKANIVHETLSSSHNSIATSPCTQPFESTKWCQSGALDRDNPICEWQATTSKASDQSHSLPVEPTTPHELIGRHRPGSHRQHGINPFGSGIIHLIKRRKWQLSAEVKAKMLAKWQEQVAQGRSQSQEVPPNQGTSRKSTLSKRSTRRPTQNRIAIPCSSKFSSTENFDWGYVTQKRCELLKPAVSWTFTSSGLHSSKLRSPQLDLVIKVLETITGSPSQNTWLIGWLLYGFELNNGECGLDAEIPLGMSPDQVEHIATSLISKWEMNRPHPPMRVCYTPTCPAAALCATCKHSMSVSALTTVKRFEGQVRETRFRTRGTAADRFLEHFPFWLPVSQQMVVKVLFKDFTPPMESTEAKDAFYQMLMGVITLLTFDAKSCAERKLAIDLFNNRFLAQGDAVLNRATFTSRAVLGCLAQNYLDETAFNAMVTNLDVLKSELPPAVRMATVALYMTCNLFLDWIKNG